MGKRLLSYDPATKTKTWHDYDHSDKKTRIITVQDAEPALKRARKLRDMHQYTSSREDLVHIGYVPNNILVKWKQEHGVDVWNKDDLPKVEQLLNKEYKKLRTVDRI